MELKRQTLDEALQKLLGAPLMSVDFVEDYVQLEWKNSFLTAHTMPTLLVAGNEYREDNCDYRPAMYRLEGQQLSRAEVIEGEALNLLFVNGTLLTISLRDADYVVAEALLYRDEDGQLWVV
jgi:hypothetical protein